MIVIEEQIWGYTPEGRDVILYTMTNARGEKVQLSNIGAGIVSVVVADRLGQMEDVTLGYDAYQGYFTDGPCMGKTPGRFANRIGKGQFSLDGKSYQLAVNNGPNHLHGGPTGFANRLWDSKKDGDKVIFTYVSTDGEEGYPGQLTARVSYEWDDSSSLKISYKAETSAATILNLTNHAYWNLRGESSGAEAMLSQELQINATTFLWYDEGCVPTGVRTPVEGTPMDFTQPKAVGRDIGMDYEPLKIGAGYDQCWVLDQYQQGDKRLNAAGYLYDAVSGRKMDFSSTQPGVQIYTGNWLKGCPRGKSGKDYQNRDGIAIECQAFPDAPNKPDFPSSVLRPGEIYEQKIVFAFSAK